MAEAGLLAGLELVVQLVLVLVLVHVLQEVRLQGQREWMRKIGVDHNKWNYKDGIMLHKGLVYVPNNEALKRKVVQLFHDNLMGHPGQWKTLELISREYYWPGMTEFIKAYIKGCATCQTTKIRPPVKVPIKPNEIPEAIWETMTMDFITDLPTLNGYDSILTVIDRHSKAIILSPCHKTITAEQTSQLLLDNVWKRTGFPKAIISDRGLQFAAQVTQELWRMMNLGVPGEGAADARK